jgi:alpha-tubulin suppressor-like RCC1 family protein
MGDNLPNVAIGGSAVSLSCGYDNACIVLSNGVVRCWGDNAFNQVGVGGNIYGDDSTETVPPIMDLGTFTAQQTSIGYGDLCTLSTEGVKCWGQNGKGQLGQGSSATTSVTGATLVPIGEGDSTVQLASAAEANCVLLQSGHVECWGGAYVVGNDDGDIEDGLLAQPTLIGTLGNIGDSPGEIAQLTPINLGPGKTVRKLSTGRFHACALLASGEIKCWGTNTYGQLGLGNTNTVGVDAIELGATMRSTIVN